MGHLSDCEQMHLHRLSGILKANGSVHGFQSGNCLAPIVCAILNMRVMQSKEAGRTVMTERSVKVGPQFLCEEINKAFF